MCPHPDARAQPQTNNQPTSVTDHNVQQAIALAELPDIVRGYETLKLERGTAFRARLADAVAGFSR